MTKSKSIDGPGAIAVFIGAILVVAGIKGWSVLAIMQNMITGKPIATNATITRLTSVEAPEPSTIPIEPDPSSSTQTPTGNRALGKQLAASYGWTGAQWTALEKLWTRESNWNNRAKNPSSGAYGIPQALPHTKMPKAAWPESAGGTSDARAQILWGLAYIKQRYGTPIMAWSFWQRNNWY